MSEPFFDYIANHRHTVSNNLYGEEHTEKRYERITYAPLPNVPEPQTSFVETLRSRKSARGFAPNAMSLSELSGILRFSIARDKNSLSHGKYFFPSAGGFLPIETYLWVLNVSGLQRGIYHYSSTEHSLAPITRTPEVSLDMFNQKYGCVFNALPHTMLLMTMVKSRIIRKYGSLCYPLCLIEAGHRGQAIALSASAFNLGACPMGTDNYKDINSMLEIDGMNEHHIYAMAIGKTVT